MSDFHPGELEVDIDDADNTVAHHGNVLVQVRSGDMTPRALDRIESTARLLRSRIRGSVGALLVIEEHAGIASGATRAQQRKVIGDMLADGRTLAAVVIEGSGVSSRMMRTVARSLLPRHSQVFVTADVASAASWLAGRVDRSAEGLEALVAHVRGIAHGGRAGG